MSRPPYRMPSAPPPRHVREIRRVQAFGSSGPEPIDLVTYSDGEVQPRRVDVSNIDDALPRYLRSVAPGQFELVTKRLELDEQLRQMLRADEQPLVPFVPQSDGLFKTEPRTRFRDRDTFVWLRTFFAALYRELYAPAHLRRYL